VAGHSKWANIKHRKDRQDQKRGRQFSRIIREITVAAKLFGPSPEDNPRLRTAISKASAENIPKDTIARAIHRGAGEDETCMLEEMTYEGYAPGGVAVLVEVMTDNRNRTIAEVRRVFNKSNAALGAAGSVSYLFSKKGLITIEPRHSDNEEVIMDLALEAGAEDMDTSPDGTVEIITAPGDLTLVQKTLAAAGQDTVEADLVMIPSTRIALDVQASLKLMQMIDALEDLEDVQAVHTNAELADGAHEEGPR